LLTDKLFESILIEPAKLERDELFIVSGYATSAMAFHHLDRLRSMSLKPCVKLIIGMCSQDGLPLSNHRGFQKVVDEDFKGQIECNYLVEGAPVHSKVYLWLKEGKPDLAFLGSANYTQNAFGGNLSEAMEQCDPSEAFAYYKKLSSHSIYCTHEDAEHFVTIYSDNYFARLKRERKYADEVLKRKRSKGEPIIGQPKISVSLLDNDGDLPQRSGLNWGQRPEEHREPNQAYIRLPAPVYKSDFFPPIGSHFTVLTNDGKVLICSRAQQNGKAIHTPHNNSLIGEYFRGILGIASGDRVTKKDLKDYGRTGVDFYKIDSETYHMDFSPPRGR